MAYQPFILTGLLLFLMGCLCTLFLLFFKLSAQKINVRNTLRKTMSGSHIFLFSVFAAVFSMIAIPLFQSGRDSDAALAYILTTTAVGGLFVFFGNGFLRISMDTYIQALWLSCHPKNCSSCCNFNTSHRRLPGLRCSHQRSFPRICVCIHAAFPCR